MNFSWVVTQGRVGKPTSRLNQGERAGMDAVCRQRRFLLRWIASCLLVLCCTTADAASKRTQNFIIQAPTPQLAEAVAEAAERYRRDLAMHWLGKTLPAWPRPCPIRVVSGPRLAAQGVTTYNPAPVRDFQMEVIGTPQRILDSVLPHEITHTILATYFGRPLPRWADEGICTTVEHAAERKKHEAKLQEFLRSRRGIAMNQLFLLKEYPNDVLPMYAQGYSVCRFLINQQGPRTFINFLEDYMRNPSWTDNIRQHYGYASLAELQQYWLAWVSEGCGEVAKYAKTQPQPGSGQLATNVGDVSQAERDTNAPGNTSPGNTSPGNAVLAGGQSDSLSNSYSSVVQAAQNQQSGMNLQAPAANQLALNAPTATASPNNAARTTGVDSATDVHNASQPARGTTIPITNLTTIGNIASSPLPPQPEALPETATEAIKGYYQNQQLQAEAIRQSRGDTGLSKITIPMVPPSIRLSGKYGMNPVTAAAALDPAARLGQASASAAPSQVGQFNSTAGVSGNPNQTPLVPPFSPTGNYQTAHPQPEQQISAGGQAVPSSPSPPSQHSRLGTAKRY
jgi:hypothetical protein